MEVVIDVQVDVPEAANEAFTYDKVGNRATDGHGSEWTYNANNELLAAFPSLGDRNAIKYEYDANGNTIAMRAPASLGGHVLYSYVYNAADRLVNVCGFDVDAATCQTATDPLAEYAYDPFGRRVWKEVGGTTTYFFYADEGLVAEYDGTGTETTAYGYRPNSTWTTDPLFLKQDGVYYFYQNDHLGTPQKLVGVNGGVVWAAQYTAFGKVEVQVETVVNHLRFPGQYYDAETGLYYNCNRYYDVRGGRYLSHDLYDHRLEANLYSYVNLNPINWIDPFGLVTHAGKSIGGILGGIAGGIYGGITVGGTAALACVPGGFLAIGCGVGGVVAGVVVGAVNGALIGATIGAFYDLLYDVCYIVSIRSYEEERRKLQNQPQPSLREVRGDDPLEEEIEKRRDPDPCKFACDECFIKHRNMLITCPICISCWFMPNFSPDSRS